MMDILLLALVGVVASETSVWCQFGSAAAIECTSQDGHNSTATAWVTYNKSMDQIGWDTLFVSTNAQADPVLQAYAGGYGEGLLTASRIAQHRDSFFETTFNGTQDQLYKEALDFVTKNDQYVTEMSRQKHQGDLGQFWQQVKLVQMQMDGMVAATNLSRSDFLLVNALVDLSSIIHKPFDVDKWDVSDLEQFRKRSTHCSALVRVTPGFQDLFTSHNTWTGFFTMLRVLKHYDFPFDSSRPSAVFPGYFGTITSTDDYFVLSNQLVVQETTNAVTNKQLLSKITPSSVLTWYRTVVANRLATDGPSWVRFFSFHNSGTINNQWMVVDYSKFTPGSPLPVGTLTIAEQLPDYMQSADVTQYLNLGYWPSYNSPFFPETRQLSGAVEMEKKFGPSYSYGLDPRAKIFRRDAPTTYTLEDMKRLMRYNDWQHDPFAAAGYGGESEPRSPENQIASRYDLIPPNETQTKPELRSPFGNTDAKLVSSADVRAMRFHAISGPTHETQPVFSWATPEWSKWPHYGQVDSFDFDWVQFAAAP